MKRAKMQNESLIKKETKKLSIDFDLDTKKEIAKIGMTASLGIVTATSFYMKNNLMKNLHIGSGVALIGFSFWHHMLYQPNKKDTVQVETKKTKKEESSISINKIYTELNVTGKLTSEDIKSFEKKLEALVREHKVSSIDTLVNISEMNGVSLTGMWEDLVFYLKNIKIIDRIAVVGTKKLGKISSKIAKTIIPKNMAYFDNYKDANNWILNH
jgi:LysM repeat protein